MKLDVKHLDRLIAEELQTLFELTKEQERANIASGFSKSGHRTKAGQRSADAPHKAAPAAAATTTTTPPATTTTASKTTTTAPKTDDKLAGTVFAQDAPATSKTTPPKPDDKAGLYTSGVVDPDWNKPRQPAISVPRGKDRMPGELAAKRAASQKYIAKGIAGATPIVGGLMTAKDIAGDKEAGAGEKAVRYAAAAAQELFPVGKALKLGKAVLPGAKAIKKGYRTATKIGDAATAVGGGEDPVDAFIKRSFQRLPGRKRTPEAEKKHQAQQKQAAAAQAGTDVGGGPDTAGMTQAQLDARNKRRLAARAEKKPPATAQDKLRQQKWALKQLSKAAPMKHGGGRGGGGLRQAIRAQEKVPRIAAVREGVKSTMLTENQIKRFQKLANCRSPQKRLITEAVDPMSIIGFVLAALVFEKVRTGWEKGVNRMLGSELEDDPFGDAPMATTLKFVWKKLEDVAGIRSEKGDSSLESTLDTLESSAERNIDRLSPESVAAIQKEFGDDEQLAALLGQLGEVQEEEYGEVLSQVEDHIASKLGI